MIMQDIVRLVDAYTYVTDEHHAVLRDMSEYLSSSVLWLGAV